jgi:hypothetical protein
MFKDDEDAAEVDAEAKAEAESEAEADADVGVDVDAEDEAEVDTCSHAREAKLARPTGTLSTVCARCITCTSQPTDALH